MTKESEAKAAKEAITHKIIDPGLFACLAVLHVHKDTESNLKKLIKGLTDDMKEGIKRYTQDFGTPLILEVLSVDPNRPVLLGAEREEPEIRTVTVTPGMTSTIDTKKLLDAGIHPDIINACTVETPSESARVT